MKNEYERKETLRKHAEMRNANAEFEKLHEMKYDTGQTMQVGDCCVTLSTGGTFNYLQCLEIRSVGLVRNRILSVPIVDRS